MLCHQARKRLDKYHWRLSDYGEDLELLEHLKVCPDCRLLTQAEATLLADLTAVSEMEPENDLSLEAVRLKVESGSVAPSGRASFWQRIGGLLQITRYRVAVGAAVVAFAFIAFVPFNFKELVGYQIAIAGVEKSIAEENPKITSLLSALGMEKDKASTLLDPRDTNQIRLSVGECRETCRLTISDLRTEEDVRVVVEAIIKLGCCQIDDIAPIFRNESTSLLQLAARKLLS
jgi:hypothetical protein